MIGDWVLIEDKARIDALEPMYKGPWLVMERKGVNLHVQCTNTGRKSVVSINRCKKIPPVPQSSMIEELPGSDELSSVGEEDPEVRQKHFQAMGNKLRVHLETKVPHL